MIILVFVNNYVLSCWVGVTKLVKDATEWYVWKQCGYFSSKQLEKVDIK
jgi:hypothetical protein|tara:strand:- start:62 stop:208 length:147 start_codon:yes stop_codon:yes gene_type:complete